MLGFLVFFFFFPSFSVIYYFSNILPLLLMYNFMFSETISAGKLFIETTKYEGSQPKDYTIL